MRKAAVVKNFDPVGFQAFWALYPKKAARLDAYKAWCQKAPSPDVQAQIGRALSWQVTQDDWTKSGGCFVPLPASYLRGERWTDERRNGDRRTGVNKTTATVLDALSRDETYD